MKTLAPFRFFLLGGAFLFVDRFFKWQATHDWDEVRVSNNFFGWEPFFNRGVAFSIPLPLPLVIILTILIIGSVIYFFYENRQENRDSSTSLNLGLTLVLTGALSNLADRILFRHTIDYLRIFTGVINLADVFIVLGFVLYFKEVSRRVGG